MTTTTHRRASIECRTCGAAFAATHTGTHCSQECRTGTPQALRSIDPLRGAARARAWAERQARPCRECGRRFRPRGNAARYCGNICRREGARRT